jgi:hypothetical protein
MSEVQRINALGPSSFRGYPRLQVFLDQEITLADFTSRILALLNTINGLISSLGDQGTFLPATIVVSADGGWDEDDDRMNRLRAFMDISKPENTTIVRIGKCDENEEDWVHSEIYVEGKVVSKTREGEIRKKFDWFDGQR